MKPAFLIVALLAIGAILTWEFLPMQRTVWDGGFDLTVNVSSTAGPLRSVMCKSCRQREETEFILEHSEHQEARSCAVFVDPFDGKPLTAHVPLSGVDSPCGRDLRRFQDHYLVVIGQLQDGRQMKKVVEIPDCRESREVSLLLP